MKITAEDRITEVLELQRQFFASNATKDLQFRLASLKRLRSGIERYQPRIIEALWTDLRKSHEESFITEISMVMHELGDHIRNLKKWVKPERVGTPIYLQPGRSRILHEPLGVALILSPWNYPFQLLLNSLIGAISAGCCAIIKSTPYTPHVVQVIEDLISETFPPEHIFMAHGGREENKILLRQRFDFIFFTGGSALGSVVMKAAAENLTPLVLELGGKSPCIVDADANIRLAARRIAWGKMLNSGQSCIAADYVLVHQSKMEELISSLIEAIEAMYGKDAKISPHYSRMVNDGAFERVSSLIGHGRVRYGGIVDKMQRYIAPTILDEVRPDSELMSQEIFGPVLPVISVHSLDEAVEFVNSRNKPLALYYFGRSDKAGDVMRRTTAGGGCLNDTVMHIANPNLPFGGVGTSGFGKYHGRDSFLAFSNRKAVLATATWVDWPLRYPPFRYFGILKRLLS